MRPTGNDPTWLELWEENERLQGFQTQSEIYRRLHLAAEQELAQLRADIEEFIVAFEKSKPHRSDTASTFWHRELVDWAVRDLRAALDREAKSAPVADE